MMHGTQSVETGGSRGMRRYLLCFAIGGLAMFFSLAGALVGLRAADSLPPPQIANSLCIDEKLDWMRKHPPENPDLLVVGSSAAWRNFNSEAAIAADPGLRPYNAGFCGLKVRQAARVALWLAERLPSVRHVVLLATPFDFDGCGRDETSTFDIIEADRYVFGGGSTALFYARYFDPVTLAWNAREIRHDRSSFASENTLVQTRWGDAPSETGWRGLHYGQVEKLDPACFAALRRMAQAFDRRGVALDVAMMPMVTEWDRQFGDPEVLPRLRADTRAALAGTSARLREDFVQPEQRDYFDAMHLRWSQTPSFTRALVRAVETPSEQHAAL